MPCGEEVTGSSGLLEALDDANAAPFVMFCGGLAPHSILSVASSHLLPYLSLVDATALRATCSEARAAVAAHPFDELQSYVPGKLLSVFSCFPNLRALSLRWKPKLTDADFVALARLRTLDFSNAELRGAAAGPAFRHLTATTLDISHVVTLSPAAFEHMGHVRVLRMAWLRQASVTDACLARLRSVRTLDMTLCWQEGITDAGLRALVAHGALRSIKLGGCTQKGVTDEGVAALLAGGIEELDVSGCHQLTDASFADTMQRLAIGERVALRVLDVSFCPKVSADALHTLRLSGAVEVVKRRSERETVGGV